MNAQSYIAHGLKLGTIMDMACFRSNVRYKLSPDGAHALFADEANDIIDAMFQLGLIRFLRRTPTSPFVYVEFLRNPTNNEISHVRSLVRN